MNGPEVPEKTHAIWEKEVVIIADAPAPSNTRRTIEKPRNSVTSLTLSKKLYTKIMFLLNWRKSSDAFCIIVLRSGRIRINCWNTYIQVFHRNGYM